MSYNKTLWENNKTVVDAEKLNKVEDQLQVLTMVTVDNNDRIQVIEDTLPMKENVGHRHDEDYASKEHTHPEYSSTEHDHDARYAPISHNHSQYATNESVIDAKQELVSKINADISNVSNDLLETNSNVNEVESQVIEVANDLRDTVESLKVFYDDIEIEDGYLKMFSHGKLMKSVKLPVLSGGDETLKAICGDVLCGDVVSGQGLEISRSVSNYDPTVWQDGITPINAVNLNKIEGKILDLVTSLKELEDNGVDVGGYFIHVGAEAPSEPGGLWIDNSDEEVDDVLEDTILDRISSVLQDHKGKLAELFFLTDAYLDDGEFTDAEEAENNIDGGTF